MKITFSFSRETDTAFDVAALASTERVVTRLFDTYERILRGEHREETPKPAPKPAPEAVHLKLVPEPPKASEPAPPTDLAHCRDVLADVVAKGRSGGKATPFAHAFLDLNAQGWADVDAYVRECGSLPKAMLAVWTTDGVAVSDEQHQLDALDSEAVAHSVLMTLFALGKAVPHYWARLPETPTHLDLSHFGGPSGA